MTLNSPIKYKGGAKTRQAPGPLWNEFDTLSTINYNIISTLPKCLIVKNVREKYGFSAVSEIVVIDCVVIDFISNDCDMIGHSEISNRGSLYTRKWGWSSVD